MTDFLLFAMLLIQPLVKADLAKVPAAGGGGALLLAALAMSLLCLALRPLLARLAIDGPSFTPIFQGATRSQTYLALAVSKSLCGAVALALASVAMVHDHCAGQRVQRRRARPRCRAGTAFGGATS